MMALEEKEKEQKKKKKEPASKESNKSVDCSKNNSYDAEKCEKCAPKKTHVTKTVILGVKEESCPLNFKNFVVSGFKVVKVEEEKAGLYEFNICPVKKDKVSMHFLWY